MLQTGFSNPLGVFLLTGSSPLYRNRSGAGDTIIPDLSFAPPPHKARPEIRHVEKSPLYPDHQGLHDP